MAVRSIEQRKQDVVAKLVNEVDLWVASADDNGEAYLIPLSFGWTGERLVMATPERSITARNLLRAGRARVALGPTRDVVIIEGEISIVAPEREPALCEAHARQAGFDARDASVQFVFLILTPDRIQAWRNPAELENRDVMLHGRWVC